MDFEAFSVETVTSVTEVCQSELPSSPMLGCVDGKARAIVTHPLDDVELDRQKLVELTQIVDVRTLEAFGGVKGVTNLLGASPEQGIKDDLQELDKRRKIFGSNDYAHKPTRSIFNCCLHECKNIFVILLMLCGLLTLVSTILKSRTDWHDGVSIIVVVVLVVLIKSIVNYGLSFCFLGIDERSRNIQAGVLRGGEKKQVAISDLVVGDIVFLKIGDRVPADGLLLDGYADLTGENDQLIRISSREPFLRRGSIVLEGHGRMVVTKVGASTEWGQVMAFIDAGGGITVEETPLQLRVKAGLCVRKVGLCVALSVLVVSLFSPNLTVRNILKGAPFSWEFKLAKLSSLVGSMGVAVALMVVAWAEGLPQAVAFSLVITIKRMMAEGNALVRSPADFESMGRVTCICTDKTCTLRVLNGDMVVSKAWVAGEMRDPCSALQNIDECVRDLLLEGIAQNSSGSVFIPEGGGEAGVSGSPIEKVTLHWGLQLGLDYAHVRAQSTILQDEPFKPSQKKSGVALTRVADSGKVQYIVHWKGAAEVILASSDKVVRADNSIMPLTPDDKDYLLSVIKGMGAESLCCIAFSYMQIDGEGDIPPTGGERDKWKIPEEGSTLLAIIGIKSPCRPEVPEAVAQCQNMAGVKVRMLTGDSLSTAKAVATECGILKDGDLAVDCSTLTQKQRESLFPKITVLARSSPSDKLLMVETLRQQGEVVAVTGDGVHDRCLLRRANIGLAMGIEATEVAKECSDVIILDASFASVVRTLKWGRCHLLTVHKYLQFQMTARPTVIVVNVISIVYTGEASLTLVQLLWINLLIDTLGALALAGEPPTDSVLKRAPIDAEEHLISNIMWRNSISQIFYQVVVLVVLQFNGTIRLLVLQLNGTTDLLKLDGGPGADQVVQTVVFSALVLCQLVGLVNARKIEEMNIFQGILSNHLLLGIMGSTLILLYILVQFLNMFASTVKISWQLWLLSLGVGAACWPFACLFKLLPVPKRLTLTGTNQRRSH